MELCLEDAGAEHPHFNKQCLKAVSRYRFVSAVYNENVIRQYEVSDDHVPKHISSVRFPVVWDKVHGNASVPAVVQCVLTSVSTTKMTL